MIYDGTVPIANKMPVWPGDPPVQLTAKSHRSRDKSHTVRLTAIEMSSHTGTHIDAPFHMIDRGKKLHELSLEVLDGKAAVLEVAGARSLGLTELEGLDWSGVVRVLFKTENSKQWRGGKIYENYVYFVRGGVAILV